MKYELSIVIPIYNEEASITELITRIGNTLDDKKLPYELVFIDDGSTDGTLELLKKYSRDHRNIGVFSFRRNMGKALALTYGFKKAEGKYIATMDADLQDEPENIPKMLDVLKVQSLDLVNGWRKNRKDSILKVINSKFFNRIIIPFLFGVKFHDMNSGLKIYKSDLSKEINLYGGMHRFIPVIASQMGFKVGEIDVVHHPRKYGYSKFKSTKVLTDIPDLLTMFFLVKFNNRPLHFFSILGGVLLGIGFFALAYLVVIKILGNPIGDRPLLIFGVLLVITGLQTIFTGLLADLMVNFRKSPDSEEISIKYKSS